MVSSFPKYFCVVVLLFSNVNENLVHAIFNEHLESLANVLHHGDTGGGLGAIFGRGGRNNNKNTSGHDHDSHDHDDSHAALDRESSRPRGKNRGSQRKPNNRVRPDCDCSGNAALLNEFNGIQNAGALNTLVRALALQRSHQHQGILGNSLSNLGLGNLGNSGSHLGLGNLGNSGSHLGLGGLGNSVSNLGLGGLGNSVSNLGLGGLGNSVSNLGLGNSVSNLGLGGLGNSGSHLGLGGLGNGLNAGALNSILNGHGHDHLHDHSHGHSVSHQAFGGHGSSVGHGHGYGSGLGIFGSHNSGHSGHSVSSVPSVPSVPTYNGWTRHVSAASSHSNSHNGPGTPGSYDTPKTVYKSGFRKTGVTGGYGHLPASSNLVEQIATSKMSEAINDKDTNISTTNSQKQKE